MRILVTGGAGFIGSHVVEAYAAAGHEVCVVDNMSSGFQANVPENIELAKVDLRDMNLERNINHLDFDIICHHAAQISVPGSVKYPEIDAEVNIFGLLNLMQIAQRWKIKRVIYISSGGAVYGEPENIPVNEQAPTNPLSPYAISKLTGETYLEYYRRTYGIDYVVLRYANVFGPRQVPQSEAGVVAIFMDKLKNHQSPTIYCPPDMPEGAIRDYVYVQDCVQANLLALTRGDNQIFNIGSGQPTTTLQVWKELLAASGVEDPPKVAMAGLRSGDVHKITLDTQKARDGLGWEPKYSLRDGLAETWQWFVEK